MSQYFDNDFSSENIIEFSDTICNKSFKFTTSDGIFSKGHVDGNTKVMLETIVNNEDEFNDILDIGCGYGPVGIFLSKVYSCNVDMIDINLRAVEYAKINVEANNVNCNVYHSNLYEEVSKQFDLIVSNPPIRAGKAVCYELYKSSFDYLVSGGMLYLVIAKKHGAKSTIDYLQTIYPSVNVVYKKSGLFVIKCVK